MAMPLTDAYVINKNSERRHKNDYYPTPPFITYALHRWYLVEYGESIPGPIWEPAAGRGWMSWELERLGYDVVSSDLNAYPRPIVPEITYGVDFLDNYAWLSTVDGKIDHCRSVITNPPYNDNLAERFAAFAAGGTGLHFFALLVRNTFCESLRRHAFFKACPPSDILYLSGRFSCVESMFADDQWMRGMVSFAWWVWDHRHRPIERTRADWINLKDMLARWKAENQRLTFCREDGLVFPHVSHETIQEPELPVHVSTK